MARDRPAGLAHVPRDLGDGHRRELAGVRARRAPRRRPTRPLRGDPPFGGGAPHISAIACSARLDRGLAAREGRAAAVGGFVDPERRRVGDHVGPVRHRMEYAEFSATIIAMDARLPPMSGVPTDLREVPSSFMFIETEVSPLMLNQKPVAMPATLVRA
jgi:hypothetical protein